MMREKVWKYRHAWEAGRSLASRKMQNKLSWRYVHFAVARKQLLFRKQYKNDLETTRAGQTWSGFGKKTDQCVCSLWRCCICKPVAMHCRLAEVRWENQNIIVLDQVTIVPPYRVDDCSASDPSNQALQHVRKLVTTAVDSYSHFYVT